MSRAARPDIRCLFVVDDIAPFREAAALLHARGVAMSMAKDAATATQLAERGRFDVLILAANSIASESMRFLQCRRERRCPVIGVTCEPGLLRALIDAGADPVIDLSEGSAKLVETLELVSRTASRSRPQRRERGRLWQRFGL